MITSRSTYDQVVAEIESGVDDCVADNPEFERDQVWADIAESLLYDASERIGREVCQGQLGFVPQALERHWHAQAEAKRTAALARARERTLQLRAEKAAAEKAAEEEALAAVKASRCPDCFVVRTPAGNCNCV